MLALLAAWQMGRRGAAAARATGTPAWRTYSGIGALVALLGPVLFVWATSSAPTVTQAYTASCSVMVIVAAAHALWLHRHAATHRPPATTSRNAAARFFDHRLALFSSVLLVFLIDTALLAGLWEQILGVNHEDPDVNNIYALAAWPHLLGTDDVGQDVFVRLLFGGRISLAVGIISALSSALIGTLIGLCAGYLGGIVDAVLMRLTDAMLAIPVLPLMIVFSAVSLDAVLGAFSAAAVLGAAVAVGAVAWALSALRQRRRVAFDVVFALPLMAAIALTVVVAAVRWAGGEGSELGSVVKIIVIIVLFGWMTVARLARAAALTLRDRDFVVAARALGASRRRVLMQHVLPSALAPVIVAATLEVGGNILYEAALSYLGLGVQPPVPSWGNMLKSGLLYVRTDHALLALWPGLLILITVVCFNLFGDGMRDALDPHRVIRKRA